MTNDCDKRLPGIPHRTLEHITTSAGGVITPYLDGNKTRIKMTLGNQTFDAGNNTALLKQVFSWVREETK